MTSAATVMTRLRKSPLTVIALGALGLSLAVLVPVTPVRAIIVFPLALTVPGYGLVLLALGRARNLDWVPLVALSVIVSIAFYALAGVLLSATSIAISTRNTVIAVDYVTILVIIGSVLRRTPAAGVANGWMPSEPPAPEAAESTRGGVRLLVIAVAALAIAGVAVGLALHFEPKVAAPPYTQFLSDRELEPAFVADQGRGGATLTVPVAVTNQSSESRDYLIAPDMDGRAAWPRETILLGPGEKWSGTVRGRVPRLAGLHELTVALSEPSTHSTPETLDLWVRASRAASGSAR